MAKMAKNFRHYSKNGKKCSPFSPLWRKWREIDGKMAKMARMAKINGENGEFFSRHFAMAKIEKNNKWRMAMSPLPKLILWRRRSSFTRPFLNPHFSLASQHLVCPFPGLVLHYMCPELRLSTAGPWWSSGPQLLYNDELQLPVLMAQISEESWCSRVLLNTLTISLPKFH